MFDKFYKIPKSILRRVELIFREAKSVQLGAKSFMLKWSKIYILFLENIMIKKRYITLR